MSEAIFRPVLSCTSRPVFLHYAVVRYDFLLEELLAFL